MVDKGDDDVITPYKTVNNNGEKNIYPFSSHNSHSQIFMIYYNLIC